MGTQRPQLLLEGGLLSTKRAQLRRTQFAFPLLRLDGRLQVFQLYFHCIPLCSEQLPGHGGLLPLHGLKLGRGQLAGQLQGQGVLLQGV